MSILWINTLKFYSLFWLYQVEGYRNILKLSCRLLAFSSYYALERGLELVSVPHVLHNFWRKIFLLLYSINWPSLIVWLPLLHEILGIMCKKFMIKTWITWERKELLRWNKKHSSLFLKDFQWSKKWYFFERWECDLKAMRV